MSRNFLLLRRVSKLTCFTEKKKTNSEIVKPTAESAPIAGLICFYNEKVDIYIDGVKEEK